MLFNIVPEELIERTNESELVLYFKNGSILQLKGADDPDALRGPNPVGIVFDEAEKIKKEAWEIVEPIIRANGGWVWFIGTPMGKNWFYDFYNRGLEGHKEWGSWLLKASESGIIPPDQLIESRKTQPQDKYNQEWECEFLEGAGQVFRGIRGVMTSEPEKPKDGHLYVMGVDLAKVTDYTVITVYDRENNNQVYQDRFNTLEWPYQKMKIRETAKHYNNALVMLDATGLGDPIADDLIRAGVAVEPIKLTEQSKKDIIEKLSLWIEQRRLSMINLEQTVLELDNYSFEVGETGRIRYGAPQGYHDDIVIAHALATWSLQPIIRIPKIAPSAVQTEYARAKRRATTDEEGLYQDF